KVIINPRGPLNMIRGYVYSEMGYMHCKRFLSPEIETDYTLKWVDDDKDPEGGAYQHTREAKNDKAYGPSKNAAVGSPEHSEYSENYHNTLIRMFPSVDGRNLSIHVAKEDSFISTLQRICTKEQANYVLASLLLLSEGVIVPINATQTKVTLWKTINAESEYKKAVRKDKKTSNSEYMFFEADAKLHMSVPQKDFAKVVDFFKKYNKPEELPDTYGMFIRGKFLNTPQFLIQAYVFEYIESQEDAVQFLECVHTLLESLGCVKELAAGKKDIYNQCFCATEEKEKAEEYLQPFSEVYRMQKMFDWFPFYTKSMLPHYKSVRSYNKGQGKFTNDIFANCVETGLYALFCCLAYDAKEKKYDVLRMLGDRKDRPETKPLRDFFGLKDVAPNKYATMKVFEEWNKVVSNLKCDRIDYKSKNRNQIRTNTLNVLYVIAEVTGRLETEQEKIDGFAQRLNSEEDPGKNIYKEIEEYISSLFKELSVGKNMEVSFSNGRRDVREDGKFKFFAHVCLDYKDQATDLTLGLEMRISPGHLTLGLHESDQCIANKRKVYATAEKTYRSDKVFAGCLFSKYFLAWLIQNGNDVILDQTIANLAKHNVEAVHPGRANMVFILNPIISMSRRSKIMPRICMCAKSMSVDLNRDRPATRLVLNTLGSVILEDNSGAVDTFLRPLVQLSQIEAFKPKVTLTPKKIGSLFMNSNHIAILHKYAPKGSDAAANATMEYFREYKKKTGVSLFQCSSLFLKPIPITIFAGDTIRLVDEIRELLSDAKDTEREEAAEASYVLDLFWLVHALHMHSTQTELIEKLYDRIVPLENISDNIIENIKAMCGLEELKNIVGLLKMHMETRRTGNDDKKLDKILKTVDAFGTST
ncbi:uncharacterized protein NEMAJ01_2323, partial [Nematocida major]|uniref:uncharacterized protein n=1 Tax=Nematocida major TaxID=1912982 RepID=UPI002008247F